MKKNKLIVLSITLFFMMSLFSGAPIHASSSLTNDHQKISVTPCDPLKVLNGEVKVDINIDDVYGVYRADEFNYSLPYNNQTASNYHANSTSFDFGGFEIWDVNLIDNTEVVAVVKDQNGNYIILDSYCDSSTPDCVLTVYEGHVEVPIDFQTILGIYLRSDYNFAQPHDNQTATNHYDALTDYNDGLIKNINLSEGTEVVVVAIDKFNNEVVLEYFCPPPPPSNCFPLKVFNGQVEIPPEYIEVFGIYKAEDFDYGEDFLNQSAHNYLEDSTLDGNKIFDIPLPDGEHIIIVVKHVDGFVEPWDNVCEEDPSTQCYDLVVEPEGEIYLSEKVDSIIGVYLSHEFNYEADPLENQTVRNFYEESSQLVDWHIIKGLDLNKGDHVVVLAMSEGNLIIIDYFCEDSDGPGSNDGPDARYGVSIGDVLEYELSIGADFGIPFFGDESGVSIDPLKDGSTIRIEILSVPSAYSQATNSKPNEGDGIKMKVTVNGEKTFELHSGEMFVLPTNHLQYLLENDDPSNANLGDLKESNETHVTFRSEGSENTIWHEFTYERLTGILIGLTGEIQNDQNAAESIEFSLKLVGKVLQDNTVSDDDGTSSSPNIISTTPGFELLSLMLVGLFFVIYSRKR